MSSSRPFCEPCAEGVNHTDTEEETPRRADGERAEPEKRWAPLYCVSPVLLRVMSGGGDKSGGHYDFLIKLLLIGDSGEALRARAQQTRQRPFFSS